MSSSLPPPVALLLVLLLLLAGLTLLLLELRHRLRPASPLRFDPGSWLVQPLAGGVEIEGRFALRNPHRRMEVMLPELRVIPTLLGRSDLSELRVETHVEADHPGEPARADGYWVAYILKGGKTTHGRVRIRISAPAGWNPSTLVDSVWLSVEAVHYGPFGRLLRRDGLLLPLAKADPLQPEEAPWRQGSGFQVLPVPTHLLGVLDDPLEVLRRYTAGLLGPGDIVTIGETPLAVMQGRYRHPSMVEPSALARLLCRVFHPTSSLATACGLQTLIDEVGPARVLVAWVLGTLLKLLGLPGGFYRLAGEQARLIDDITGTTPPYDQTIVLGPAEPERCCRELARALGAPVAVVDVNDLGRVKVLAASPGCEVALLQRALRTNPAGNADERTPLVIVRPG